MTRLRKETACLKHRSLLLQAEAAAARDAAAAAAADLGPWQAALAERDAELQNLQARPTPPACASGSACRPWQHAQGMHARQDHMQGGEAEEVKQGCQAAAQR